MDLDLIITRLKATLTGFKAIGGAADLDAAIGGAVAVPAAFVIPLADSASPNGMIGFHEQLITQAFGVVLVAANRRDTTGAAALTDLNALRRQVRDALAGWAPTPEGEPVEIVGGRMLQLDGDGRLWWIDEFSLQTYYRSP
jgi:hypothetical protein